MAERINERRRFVSKQEVKEWVTAHSAEECAEETKTLAKELQHEVTTAVDSVMEKHKIVAAAGGVLFSFKAEMTSSDCTVTLFSGTLGVDRRNKAAQVLDNFDDKDLKDDSSRVGSKMSKEDAAQLLGVLRALKNILGE